MNTKTSICNMALVHLGQTKFMSNIETESSTEALLFKRIYDICRDESLREFQWPFARKFAEAQLVAEDPNLEWKFSYRYPSDCLFLKKILSGTRVDVRESLVVFELGYDNGPIILTDMEKAQIEYTARITDESKYSPDFAMLLSLKLAVVAAPSITSGDAFGLGQRAAALYQQKLAETATVALREQTRDIPPPSEFERVRS